MFHTCKLVHADLSEYNILYHDNKLYIIDVSQSVEHDHPHAFDFLRKDITNVEAYFGRYGIHVLGLRRAFEFVTVSTLTEEANVSDGEVLDRWLQESSEGGREPDTRQEDDSTSSARTSNAHHEDAVFMKSYIPRTLNELYDPERDVAVLSKGEGEKLIYKDTIGLVQPRKAPDAESARVKFTSDESTTHDQISGLQGDDGDVAEQSTGDESGSDDDGEEDEEEGQNRDREERKPPTRGHRHEDPTEKKLRKQATKEEAREKRKTKMKKAEKKKKVKATRHGG